MRKYLFFGGLRAKRELAEDPPARGRSPWRKSRARSSRWRPVASSLAATGQRTSSHQATSLPAFASTYAAPPCPPRAPARAHRTNARAQVAVRSGATKPRGGVYPKTSLFVGQVSSYCTSPDDPDTVAKVGKPEPAAISDLASRDNSKIYPKDLLYCLTKEELFDRWYDDYAAGEINDLCTGFPRKQSGDYPRLDVTMRCAKAVTGTPLNPLAPA